MERHMRKFDEEEGVLPHLTRTERDERYDEKNPVDDSAMELEAKPR